VDGEVGRHQRGEAFEQKGPVLFRQGIHLTVEGSQSSVGVFHFSILVAVDMQRIPSDWGFLKGLPQGLHEIQVLLSWVGKEINCRWFEGSGVVTGHGDGTTGDGVKATQAIHRGDNCIQASQFTPVRVTFFDWARDSVVADHMVIRGRAFDDKSRGAESVSERAIAHGNGSALGNGLSNGSTLVVGLGMLHRPKTSVRQRQDGLLKS